MLGVKAGNGTEQKCARHRETVDTWDQNELGLQREFLTLSENGNFLVAARGGHNVHATKQGVIVRVLSGLLQTSIDELS